MFTKIFLIVISLALITSVAFGYRLPTQKQLDELCIPIIHMVDNQTHFFYYKHIVSLDEKGLRVKFGKNLAKEVFYPEKDIVNLRYAIKRFKEIKEKYK